MTEKEKGEYVKAIVAEGVALGLAMARRYYEPHDDQLRSKYISQWTKKIGIEPKVVYKLVEQNKLSEHKISSSVNAARYFSLTELKKALAEEHIRTGYGGKFPEMAFTNQ